MSEQIKNRIDFVLFFDVHDGNPNGDPDAGNMPRVDAETGHGLVTDVCIKRKVRNYIALTREGKPGFDIYVKERGVLNSEHRKAYEASKLVMTQESSAELSPELAAKASEETLPDGFSLREGEEKVFLIYSGDLEDEGKKAAKKVLKEIDKKLEEIGAELIKKNKSRKPKREEIDSARDWMCKTYFDIRTFGAVMSTGVNCGQVRGPVQMTFARSIDPIFAVEHAITRVAVTKEEDQERKQTEMGRKNTVRYALYRAYGFISPALASKTGFSAEDQAALIEALAGMFEHDRSASRGRMATRALILFEHENALGSAPSHELFEKSVQVVRTGKGPVQSFEDYAISVGGQKITGQRSRWRVARVAEGEGYTLRDASEAAEKKASLSWRSTTCCPSRRWSTWCTASGSAP